VWAADLEPLIFDTPVEVGGEGGDADLGCALAEHPSEVREAAALGDDDPVGRDRLGSEPDRARLASKGSRALRVAQVAHSSDSLIRPRTSSTGFLASNDTRQYRCGVVHGRTESRALGQRE
jgi:hypothetical protein